MPDDKKKDRSKRRHEITFAGLIFIGVTCFVMIAAINTGTNLLFLAFGLMFGGLLVAGCVSWLMLRKIEVRRVMNDHAVAGEPLEFHYLLTNRKKRWPSFAIRVTEARTDGELERVPEGCAFHLAPGQSITAMTQLLAPTRGLIQLNEIRLTCAFPFGFLTHAKHILRAQSIVIYPRIGVLNRQLALRYRDAINTGTMTSNVRGGNDEFYGLREYRAGDNIHAIHWKRTACTGEIMIREMTSNAPPQMVVVLNLRAAAKSAEGAAEVERAIELAASLVCYGWMENFAVGLAIAGLPDEQAPIPLMGRESRQRLLYRLAVLKPAEIEADRAIPMPNRLGSRAEWMIVTLHRADEVRDLVPAGTRSTTLALDDPGSANWVHFLTNAETRRILREPAPTVPSV